jgi:drug/metabolite transporter (DMT)-like permease
LSHTEQGLQYSSGSVLCFLVLLHLPAYGQSKKEVSMKKLATVFLSVLPFLLLWLYLNWQQSTKHIFGDSFYLITLSLLAMALAVTFIVAVEKYLGKKGE